MKVLVAGGTGVIGRQLVPLLQEVGHDVVVLTRPGRGVGAPGVTLVEADALDGAAVRKGVRNASPDAVVNILTAIPRPLNIKKFAQQFEPTNRLRRDATAILVEAAPGARHVAESIAFGYRPEGGPVADESRAFWDDGPASFLPALRALEELERLTTGAGGLALRFGNLYGPGTGFGRDGDVVDALDKGKLPIV